MQAVAPEKPLASRRSQMCPAKFASLDAQLYPFFPALCCSLQNRFTSHDRKADRITTLPKVA